MSYNKKAHKILSFSAFIIILILSFIIITKFYNLSGSEVSIGGIFALVGIVLIMGLIQTIQIMNLTKEKIYKEDYTKKTYLSEIDKYEEDASKAKYSQDNQSKEEEKIDIEAIANKIIPENDKNTDLSKYTEKILSNTAKEYDIVQGLFYYRKKNSDTFTIASKYAYYGEEEPNDFELGETLSGQTAKNQKVLNLAQIPENYITILSGLGNSSPECLLFVPIIHEGNTIGLMELASFKVFSKKTEKAFSQLSEKIGEKISEKIT
jgi:putative methionine-R-sulfoxide reductase with GAF domain